MGRWKSDRAVQTSKDHTKTLRTHITEHRGNEAMAEPGGVLSR